MHQSISHYRHISSMEPLLPTTGRGELAELSAEIFRRSGELSATLPSLAVRAGVAELVREMNSYYSNLIEGHKTLPRDIDRAMHDQHADSEEDRRNQFLSIAHIAVEKSMRQQLAEKSETAVFSADFIQWLHQEFYQKLPPSEWFTTSLSGKRHPLEPGKLRNHQVVVGRHTPPDFQVLGDFLQRFQRFYSDRAIPATDCLIALAAAHHRLVWIHPFSDGNGRVARLQSQAAMISCGLDSSGLWTLSRGLARARPTYFQLLQAADQSRASDFDERGNLSDCALAAFCRFFLERALDQIDFMTGLISPFKLVDRIESYLRFVRVDLDSKMREHLARLLKALCLEGELPRGAVPAILGLKDTAGRVIIRRALEEGLIKSTSPKGPLSIAFPHKVVDAYFPQLFTDLPVDDC